ncbi:hypothetical protein DFH09DRAFT_1092392 [Mycena vulgaris]|nr:hypothetical protein DFH09DRAFT_1092392 [Mycena vulgaris]
MPINSSLLILLCSGVLLLLAFVCPIPDRDMITAFLPAVSIASVSIAGYKLLSVTSYLATYVFSVLYGSLIMSWEQLPGRYIKAWVLRTRLDHLAEFWLSCNGWVNFLRSHPKNNHFRVSWPPTSGRCKWVVVFPSEEFGLPMPPSPGKNLSVGTTETG